MDLTAALVKRKALELGVDLVGIAGVEALNAHPPDPGRPQTPAVINLEESRSVIILGARMLLWISRVNREQDRQKQFAAEIALTRLEELELDLVYYLEEFGYPSISVPVMHTDFDANYHGPLSLRHAAVEAGLGTLGLDGALLTPRFGPRVHLGAVITQALLQADSPMRQALCKGESCGRCLLACPGDAVEHWGVNIERCEPHASPYGFKFMTNHFRKILEAESKSEQWDLIRAPDLLQVWHSMQRSVGNYTGCTRCLEVCPVGEDYEQHLAAAQETIPEATSQKQERLVRLQVAPRQESPGFKQSERWIGSLA